MQMSLLRVSLLLRGRRANIVGLVVNAVAEGVHLFVLQDDYVL